MSGRGITPKSNLSLSPPPCLGHALSLHREQESESKDIGAPGTSSPHLAETSQEGVPGGLRPGSEKDRTRACPCHAPTGPSDSLPQ